MTLSTLSKDQLESMKYRDPMIAAIMRLSGDEEIEMVQGGYFIAPLNTDQLVKPYTVGETWDLTIKGIGTYGASYFVDDSPERFISEYGAILRDDPRRFIVFFTPIIKADQPPEGGWRWHKWGEYLGIGTPTTEYLFDEPKFERVYVGHVVQVTQ